MLLSVRLSVVRHQLISNDA